MAPKSGQHGSANKKSKGNGKGRGRETWAKCEKLELLESYKALFLEDKSAMYAQATGAFIDKWGYDLAPNDLPDPDKTYTVPDINDFGDGEERAEEEARQADFRHKLHEKIANWARHRWHRKSVDSTGLETMISSILQASAAQPRKMSDLQFYQKEYYDERIKSEFNKHWDSIKDRTGERFCIREMNSFASLKWEREPQDFKKQLHEENETRHRMDMDARKNREEWAGDAQGYENTWNKVNEILPVLSEAVARLFGAGCTIFLYGPRANGKTNVSSIYSVVPDAQTSKDIKQFDEMVYSEMHSLCQRYADASFSSEYIKTRMLNMGEDEAESMDRDNGPISNNDAVSRDGPESVVVPPPTSPTFNSASTTVTTPSPSLTPAVSSIIPTTEVITTIPTADPPPAPFSLALPTVESSTPLAPPIPIPSLDLRLSSPASTYPKHAASYMNAYDHMLSDFQQINPQYNNPDMFMGMNMDDYQVMQTIGDEMLISSEAKGMALTADEMLISSGANAAANPTPMSVGLQPTSESRHIPEDLFNGNTGANGDSSVGQQLPTLNVSAYPLSSQRSALTQLPPQIQPDIAKPVSDGKENSLKRKREVYRETDPKRLKTTAVEEGSGKDVYIRDGANSDEQQGEEQVRNGRRKRNAKAPEREPKTITGAEPEATSKKGAGKSRGTKAEVSGKKEEVKTTKSTQKTKGRGKKSKSVAA